MGRLIVESPVVGEISNCDGCGGGRRRVVGFPRRKVRCDGSKSRRLIGTEVLTKPLEN